MHLIFLSCSVCTQRCTKSPSPVISKVWRSRAKPLKSRPLPRGEREASSQTPPDFIHTRRTHPHTHPVPHGYTARRGGERGRFRVGEADAASRICPFPRGRASVSPAGEIAGVSRKTVTRRDPEQGRLPPTRRPGLHKLRHGSLPVPPARAAAISPKREPAGKNVRTAPRGQRRARR